MTSAHIESIKFFSDFSQQSFSEDLRVLFQFSNKNKSKMWSLKQQELSDKFVCVPFEVQLLDFFEAFENKFNIGFYFIGPVTQIFGGVLQSSHLLFNELQRLAKCHLQVKAVSDRYEDL